MIEPDKSVHCMALAIDCDASGGFHASERIVVGGMPRFRRLGTEPFAPMNQRVPFLMENQIDGPPFFGSLQTETTRGDPGKFPSLHPGDSSLRNGWNGKSRLAKGSPRGALERPETFPSHIGKGKMGKGKIIDPESGGSRGFLSRMNALTEEGELKSKVMPLCIGKRTRCVPPLCFEGSVRAVIPWKHIVPSGLGNAPAITSLYLFSQQKGWRENR